MKCTLEVGRQAVSWHPDIKYQIPLQAIYPAAAVGAVDSLSVSCAVQPVVYFFLFTTPFELAFNGKTNVLLTVETRFYWFFGVFRQDFHFSKANQFFLGFSSSIGLLAAAAALTNCREIWKRKKQQHQQNNVDISEYGKLQFYFYFVWRAFDKNLIMVISISVITDLNTIMVTRFGWWLVLWSVCTLMQYKKTYIFRFCCLPFSGIFH